MRARVLAAITALALLAGTASGESASRTAKKSVRCATSGHTIAKNRHIRVFRVGSPDFYSAYACVLPRGRVRHLGDYENDGGGEWDGVYGFQLAGDFVAYEDAICDRTDCTGSVKSFNVVTREMAHRARIPLGETSRFYVLVLNRHGSVAWTRPSTVWKCDAPKCVLLDHNRRNSQTWIRPYSLTLRGHVLRWTHHDGTAYSAPLK